MDTAVGMENMSVLVHKALGTACTACEADRVADMAVDTEVDTSNMTFSVDTAADMADRAKTFLADKSLSIL